MVDKIVVRVALATALVAALAAPGNASSFFFNTGNPDGKMAAASRPNSAPSGTPSNEIETGDDFVVPNDTASISSATFTGLLVNGATTANIGQVTAEIYRVFPNDSNVGRTSGPPTFSTPQVPTRVNSPSDVEFASRSNTNSSPQNLTFTTMVLSNSFAAANSILPGGIHPQPFQTTGGNGPVTGQEVQFTLTFNTPFNLPADHYFFVPQVETSAGEFLWLSAPRPIMVPPGTQFPPGFTDLQGWTRDAALDPDWLRVGGDIVGPTPATAPTFNFTFSLTGDVVPLPATLPLFATGLGALGLLGWRRKRKAQAVA
jgi:hypothetical protein